jgi:hypothetical protein
MRKIGLLALALTLAPAAAFAQVAAPELFEVREVVINYVRFPDAKAAQTCGLSRDQVATALAKAFVGTGVPVTPVNEVKPPVLGIARIDLVPEISVHTDENLDCISWVSLSAENRVNAVIPPVPTQRGVTVVYWREHSMVTSSQSTHTDAISQMVQKLGSEFAQQYRLDQPPVIPVTKPPSLQPALPK